MAKTIFITGASSGLGKATAKLFQAKGWNVIATMRNPEKETELNQLANVTLLPLDVTNTIQMEAMVEKALDFFDVDVVFNNAGYGLSGALEALTDEQIVRQINTNILGAIRITQAFIPYFRKYKKGTFITTTSIAGIIGMPLNSIYNATKFALEGWSEGLAYEMAAFGIKVKTVAPGGIDTDFSGRSLDLGRNKHYTAMEEKLFQQMETMMPHFSKPEQIAEVVYQAATDDKDQLRYVAGPDAQAFSTRRSEIGLEAFRKELSQQF